MSAVLLLPLLSLFQYAFARVKTFLGPMLGDWRCAPPGAKDSDRLGGWDYYGLYWGYTGIMEKRMETTIVYWGYTGIMENQMETTIVYWGYTGIMENEIDTTIVYWGYTGIVENEMEATIVSVLGLYWDNGKEDGHYHLGFRGKEQGCRLIPASTGSHRSTFPL